VLVLDEPTSALDPTGAEEVLAAVTRLVHDLAVTVVMAEHRVERVLQYADSVVHVGDARVGVGSPADVMTHSTIAPPVVELGRWAGWSPLPMSVRDAYRRAGDLRDSLADAPTQLVSDGDAALRATAVTVRYGTSTAVDDVTLAPLRAGEVTALMGRNGAGKSSLLWALQGTGARTAGRVDVGGRDPRDLGADARRRAVGLVPQTPADLLYLPTVLEECTQADREAGATPGTCRGLLDRVVPGVPDDIHPRDLSEGQRLALVLGIQLTARPAVLLLDEPTRGLDYPAKAALARVLRELADDEMSVLLSTHDVEFVAESADRVVMMAEGEVVVDGPATSVLVSSPAFAPQVSKVLGGGWLTVDQVRSAAT
jgi:energy-coupling factor transport system ATP-binding protein